MNPGLPVPKVRTGDNRIPRNNIACGAMASAGVARAIGRTPLVAIRRFAARHGLPANVEILLKAEWANPGGSVKDRPALAIVRSAIESGTLNSEKTLLDATSGNTGIAYAMLGAAIGFRVNLVVPESASDERKRISAAYGAEVTFSDPYDGSNGAIRLARERASADPDRYCYADQYRNPANVAAHFETTGPEIWGQTKGRVTHFVAGLGTTGTMMGTGAYLKRRNPGVILAAVSTLRVISWHRGFEAPADRNRARDL